MTLKQIKYFETVCKTGSVTSAAEELYVSRPVISRALKELEEEFGVELFTRTRLGLELTESGKVLRNLFFEFDGAYTSVQERLRQINDHGENHTLTVGITVTCGERFYPRLFSEFNEKHPEVIFNVTELSAFESRDQIATGNIDLFFTPRSAPFGTTSIIGDLPLYSIETVFCTARGSRLASRSAVTPREIIDCPMATLAARTPIDWPLNIVLRTSQQLLIRRAISEGIANAMLPRDMIAGWDEVVGISFDPPLYATARLLWNKGIPHSRAFDDFLEFIKNYDLSRL